MVYILLGRRTESLLRIHDAFRNMNYRNSLFASKILKNNLFM